MSDFNKAFDDLMHWEGSEFTDDPHDPGGATRYGVTLPFLQEFFDVRKMPETARVEDIRDLTLERARIIYREMVWDKHEIGEIIAQEPATALFLAMVNLGPTTGTKAAQRALRACGWSVVRDGILGPRTRAAINSSDAKQLAAAMRSEVAGVYFSIVTAYPERKRFLKGWLNRAYWPH